jgi:hypothetical protein
MPTPFVDFCNQAVIVRILGDAEAFVFDFEALPKPKQEELVAHHLGAFDRRKRKEGKGDWLSRLVPFALLGESMPPAIRRQFDLSAPHEGVLLFHPETGAVAYCASKDDERLAIACPEAEMLSPQASYLKENYPAAKIDYAYDVDRSESENFTLGEIETLMTMNGVALQFI